MEIQKNVSVPDGGELFDLLQIFVKMLPWQEKKAGYFRTELEQKYKRKLKANWVEPRLRALVEKELVLRIGKRGRYLYRLNEADREEIKRYLVSRGYLKNELELKIER